MPACSPSKESISTSSRFRPTSTRCAGSRDEVHGEPVCAVVESLTGARVVDDTLGQHARDAYAFSTRSASMGGC
jgi:hypothetical protein